MTEAVGGELSLDRRGVRRRSGPSETSFPPGRAELSHQPPALQPSTSSAPVVPKLFATSLAGSAACPHPRSQTRDPAGPGIRLGMALSWAHRRAGVAADLTGQFLGSKSGSGGVSKYTGGGYFFLLPVLCLITQDELKNQTSKLIHVQLPLTPAVNAVSILLDSHRYVTGRTCTVLALKKSWYRLER